MGIRGKAVSPSDLFLESLYLTAGELDDSPAFVAHHVIVVLVVVQMLEAGQAVFELDGFGELCITQELERPVDSGATDLGVGALSHSIEVINRHVPFVGKEMFEDDLALTRMFEPVLG